MSSMSSAASFETIRRWWSSATASPKSDRPIE
jgi:hypothetical protein